MKCTCCIDCEDRHLGCQNEETCENYKNFKEGLRKQKKKKVDFYRSHGYIIYDEYRKSLEN